MIQVNIKPSDRAYDAIVVGTGISGGWAAKELTEHGLETLVLERGRMVEHVKDYPTMFKDPWDFEFKGKPTAEEKRRQYKQGRTGYTTEKAHNHFFVDDIDHPYNEAKPFDWIRGYQVGGRSLTWGRHSYRLSDLDFEANAKDGYGVDWPIRYKDLAPWYDYVEAYIGVSGRKEGLEHLPDGIFLKPMELNCAERDLKEAISRNYSDRLLTIGRVANLTEGAKPGLGRSPCQYRNRCIRGCPFGAYFSSQSSTLPAATATGKMTLRPNSIVHEILYDERSKRASGVRVIDTESNETYEFKAKVIFLCASTVASTSILLQSKSNRFPEGMGNDSGELGHNLMDHTWGTGAYGSSDRHLDKYYFGNRPNGFYIPRFRNVDKTTQQKDFLRGYGYQGAADRNDWTKAVRELKFGPALTKAIVEPGIWKIGLGGFGEVLPYHDNRMYLDDDKRDKWGLPTVTFDAEYKENELKMKEDIKAQAVEMLESAGFTDIHTYENPASLGIGIHEMGTARMGKDPKTSVLNGNNQLHGVKNVFVTDGSCMTSSGTQNPSLTYMALTARAVDFAVKELNKRNL
jgi:choline dehydrogenase-like flavoprotein